MQFGIKEIESGDYVKAQQCFSQCVTEAAISTSAWNNLGLALQLEGQKEEAEKSYQKTLSQEDLYQTLLNFGNLQRQQGQFDKALESYNRCLELKSDYSLAHNNIGLVYVEMGPSYWRKAATSFDTAVRLDQTCICAIQNRKRLQELMNEIYI